MAQKEGIRHKKPLEYSAALGFLLIQLLSLSLSLYGGFPDPGKTVALAAELCYASEMMIWRFGRRDGALGETRENESLS